MPYFFLLYYVRFVNRARWKHDECETQLSREKSPGTMAVVLLHASEKLEVSVRVGVFFSSLAGSKL